MLAARARASLTAHPAPSTADPQAPVECFAPGLAAPSSITLEEYRAVMEALTLGDGAATLGNIAVALPSSRPISVVLALADAGIVIFDPTAPFGADLKITRI